VVRKCACTDAFTINEALEILRKSLRRAFDKAITSAEEKSFESAECLPVEAVQAIAEKNKQPQANGTAAENPPRAKNITTPKGPDETPAWLTESAGARQAAADRDSSGSVRRRLF